MNGSASRGFVVTSTLLLLAACSAGDDSATADTTNADSPASAATEVPGTEPPDTAPAETDPPVTDPPAAEPSLVPATATVSSDATQIPASAPFEPAWIRQLGTDASDSGFSVDVAGDDLIVVAFSTEGEFASQPAGERDVALASFTLAGEPLWTAQFGTEANDSPLGVSTYGDAIYVGGFTEGDLAAPNQGSADAWLARFDLDGNEVWRRQFGGEGWDRGFDVTASEDGAYVSGYSASTLDADSRQGGFDGFAAKFTDAGDLEWVRQFGTEATDWGQGSALAPDGGLYVTGYTEGDYAGPNAGLKDAFLLRLSPDGDEVWVRQFGSDALDWTQGVDTTADGSVLLAGSTEGSIAAPVQGGRDVLIAAYGPDGEQRFVTQFGTEGPDSVYEIREHAGGIVAHGTVSGDIGNAQGDRDMLLATFDSEGELVETVQYGSPAVDDGTGLAVAPDGTLVFLGYTAGTAAESSVGGLDVVIGALP